MSNIFVILGGNCFFICLLKMPHLRIKDVFELYMYFCVFVHFVSDFVFCVFLRDGIELQGGNRRTLWISTGRTRQVTLTEPVQCVTFTKVTKKIFLSKYYVYWKLVLFI